ncbi:hypothetical protein TSAR_016424, partial [Trichomalopsis sarcophagae]
SRQHFSVQPLRPSVDVKTCTEQTTTDTTSQTNPPDTDKGTHSSTTITTDAETQTTQPTEARVEMEAVLPATPSAPHLRPEKFTGWQTINGRQVFVNVPRPGCWACGSPDHRAPRCSDRQRRNYRYCYRCGLGNVTIRDCPVHGEAWRSQGPYIPSRGTNIPRDQLPPRQ